jgi:adenylate kinase
MPITFLFPIDAILLLGPTGVGKSPLGDAIAAQGLFGRRCHHLDFGSELRNAVSSGERHSDYSAEELAFLRDVLERGLLLENEHFSLAVKIIGLFLKRASFSQYDLLVLNGIPRHTEQASDMAEIASVHALIALDCSTEAVFCRIRENTGGDRSGRIDDAGALIEKKLAVFRERTAPLLDHYANKGCVVYRIPVSSDSAAGLVYRELCMLAAADPPVALIAEPPER